MSPSTVYMVSHPRCVGCGQLQGMPHVAGCFFARFTVHARVRSWFNIEVK